jgi:hypothetical protein
MTVGRKQTRIGVSGGAMARISGGTSSSMGGSSFLMRATVWRSTSSIECARTRGAVRRSSSSDRQPSSCHSSDGAMCGGTFHSARKQTSRGEKLSIR